MRRRWRRKMRRDGHCNEMDDDDGTEGTMRWTEEVRRTATMRWIKGESDEWR
jgi:hypothetical protein